MSASPKGYSDQKKSRPAEFATVNPVGQETTALDVNSYAFVRNVGSDAVEANSTTSSIVATGHLAKRGDIIRITSGALNGKQVVVNSTSANAIELAEVLDSAPAAAVTFDILRHAKAELTPEGKLKVDGAFSLEGDISVTPAPIQFVHDGADTEVNENTGTPASSKPLPVKLLDSSGAEVVPATAAAQSTANASLAAIETAAEAIQAAVEAPLNVVVDNFPATQPVSGTVAVSGSVAVTGTFYQATQPVSAASLPLPTGAATATKQDDANTLSGAVNETAPASDTASSGLNGRLQRIAQRLTSLIALFPTSLGQKTSANSLAVTLASDQSALSVSEATSATATSSNVSGSASSVSLLASNTSRKMATFFNDSTATLYLKLGTTASTTSYTVQLPPNAYYELPCKYTGAIDGIWSAANGAVRIVELT